MKKISVFLLCLAMSCTLPQLSMAAEKAKTKITTVKQKGNDVAFTVTSSRPFIVAANIYILHVGNRSFENSRDLSDEQKGVMTFYIPNEDYAALADGTATYLSYGRVTRDEDKTEQVLADMYKHNSRKVWYLGKFSRKMLSK